MIRSSACVAADDITVRCRVRRSPFATNPRFDVAMETMCTMRHWQGHAQQHLLQSAHSGPELVLVPVQDILENRDVTPVRHRPRFHRQQQQVSPTKVLPSYSIPLGEIVVVERLPRSSKVYKLTVTTIHQGMLEFDLRNSNRHDMLLAFLQAHLPRERLQTITAADCISVHSTCSSKSQMDVDRLQEKTIRQHANETWTEKLSRRMSKVVYSIQAMSGTLCDLTACCRENETAIASPVVASSPRSMDLREESPMLVPSYSMPVANGGHLEMDEDFSTVRSARSKPTRQVRSFDDPALQSVVL